eukprot:487850-Pelagomonas_calceolata.AAC.2
MRVLAWPSCPLPAASTTPVPAEVLQDLNLTVSEAAQLCILQHNSHHNMLACITLCLQRQRNLCQHVHAASQPCSSEQRGHAVSGGGGPHEAKPWQP